MSWNKSRYGCTSTGTYFHENIESLYILEAPIIVVLQMSTETADLGH